MFFFLLCEDFAFIFYSAFLSANMYLCSRNYSQLCLQHKAQEIELRSGVPDYSRHIFFFFFIDKREDPQNEYS